MEATLHEKQREYEELVATGQEAYHTTPAEIKLWHEVLGQLR
jgi:hypothetical protein